MARVIQKLPVEWTREAIRVAGKSYDPATHGLSMIYPNPLNPSRYLVLNSGFTFSRFGHMSNATQTPKLPDWALVDMRQPYNAGDPACIAAAGFFDERWQAPTPE